MKTSFSTDLLFKHCESLFNGWIFSRERNLPIVSSKLFTCHILICMAEGQDFFFSLQLLWFEWKKKKRDEFNRRNDEMLKKQLVVLMSISRYKDVPHIGLSTCLLPWKEKNARAGGLSFHGFSVSSVYCTSKVTSSIKEEHGETQRCVYAKLWRTVGGADELGGGNPIAQHKGKLSDQGAESGVSSATNW